MKFYTITFLVFIFLLLVPAIGFAQKSDGLVSCSGAEECNFCSLVTMTNDITQWLIIIGVFLAVLLLSFSGFKLITAGGDASALGEAKKIFISSLIGIMIMLAGWTIVDTVLKLVAGGDLGVWNVVECGGINKSVPAADFNTILRDDFKGINLSAVENFTGDHGAGSVLNGVGVNMGSGGNCPGASESDVVRVPGDSNNLLQTDAARKFVAMRTAAATDGITLLISSAWRSQTAQEEIWRRHNCDVAGCSGTVARPCSKGGSGSNHNGGVAVDIYGSSRGSDIYNWLKANGAKYGFFNNLGPDDPVHWSPTGR